MNSSTLIQIKEDITTLINTSIEKMCLDYNDITPDTVKMYFKEVLDLKMSKYIKNTTADTPIKTETKNKSERKTYTKKIPEDTERCISMTKTGEQCKKKKFNNSEYCTFHEKLQKKSTTDKTLQQNVNELLKLNLEEHVLESENTTQSLQPQLLLQKETPKLTENKKKVVQLSNDELEKILQNF